VVLGAAAGTVEVDEDTINRRMIVCCCEAITGMPAHSSIKITFELILYHNSRYAMIQAQAHHFNLQSFRYNVMLVVSYKFNRSSRRTNEI
jgi:hypothetical protein